MLLSLNLIKPLPCKHWQCHPAYTYIVRLIPETLNVLHILLFNLSDISKQFHITQSYWMKSIAVAKIFLSQNVFRIPPWKQWIETKMHTVLLLQGRSASMTVSASNEVRTKVTWCYSPHCGGDCLFIWLIMHCVICLTTSNTYRCPAHSNRGMDVTCNRTCFCCGKDLPIHCSEDVFCGSNNRNRVLVPVILKHS